MDIRIHAFPTSDRAFVEFAAEAWRDLPEPRTPEALQHAIRGRYPAAVVTQQVDLARHGAGPTVWYAFRTAAIDWRTEHAAQVDLDASPAWAILDDERRFLSLSPELAEIAELPVSVLLGHAIEEFSNPADPTVREDIARLWAEFKAGTTLASTLRFNFADGRPREVAYRLVADADGPGRHRLTARVLEP